MVLEWISPSDYGLLYGLVTIALFKVPGDWGKGGCVKGFRGCRDENGACQIG